MFAANAMAGPSAKFAATYGNDGPYLVSAVFIDDAVVDTGPVFDMSVGFTFATIKVPQQKELLVGLSAEIGITTDTSIKGKNGGAAKSIAGGRAGVIVWACPVDGGDCVGPARPGAVTLSQRIQTLTATLGGVIEECEDFTGGTDENGLNPGDDGYIDTPDGIIDVDVECIVTDEEIGLVLRWRDGGLSAVERPRRVPLDQLVLLEVTGTTDNHNQPHEVHYRMPSSLSAARLEMVVTTAGNTTRLPIPSPSSSPAQAVLPSDFVASMATLYPGRARFVWLEARDQAGKLLAVSPSHEF